MRHCSGLVYHGVWKDGNPTVLPVKLVISNYAADKAAELVQGKPFDICVQCVNEAGEVVEGKSYCKLPNCCNNLVEQGSGKHFVCRRKCL